MLYCVDTHVLIWGIKRECTPGQEDMIDRAAYFIRQCHLEDHDLIIPSVVVTELLVNFPLETHVDFLRKLTEGFIIAPYDAAAAALYARMWVEQRAIVHESLAVGVTRRHIKADFMIAATALARKCQCIYTEDGELEKFAAPYILVNRVSGITIPPKQIGIFGEGE